MAKIEQKLQNGAMQRLHVGIAFVSVGLFFAACTTDYQLGRNDPSFGGPNALAGQRPPGPTIDTLTGDGGAAAGSTPKCVVAGGTLVDAGPCAVSFSKDILSSFATANCNSAECHGGITPRNEPRVEPLDAPTMWQEFQGFTLSDGKPYINPCVADDKQSGMGCNLYEVGVPGQCGVHMPSGSQIPPDVITKVETWLKCGAPNN